MVKILEYKRPGSELLLIDGDSFEPKNKERQNFDKMGNKAVVKASQLIPLFPRTKIIPVPSWIVESVDEKVDDSDEDNEDGTSSRKIAASALLGAHDNLVVYAVVDNHKCRATIVNAAKNCNNIDVFLAGNDDGMYGTTYHYQIRDGVEVTCDPVAYHPELENPPDRNPGELSCEERAQIEGGTQLVAINRMVAAVLLCQTQRNIIEGQPVGNSAATFFDMYSCEFMADSRPPSQDIEVIEGFAESESVDNHLSMS